MMQTSNMRGLLAALGAYGLWGLFPLYMKAVAHIDVLEVVANRIIWSVPVAGLILLYLGRFGDLLNALKSPKILAMACVTSALITCNWSVYIWAIGNNHAVDAALGYYINPLLNVLLGFIFLKERLTPVQWLAVVLAVCAVAILAINKGGLPWVSLVLPFTFGLYALFRKSLPIGPAQGFMLEALILFIPAVLMQAYFIAGGTDHFADGSALDTLLLIGAGPLTAIPLILFATGAKALNLMTLGLMQYITPTILFLFAVFLFDEPFSHVELIAFSLIWLALIIYTASSIINYRALIAKEKN
ncbi:EamA family transporter RarD [Bartonella sp. HY329]|uniref:EamA family transporter RarD n=1 Tax=unclassified Bartonella TaxID=2645622 RepID=UPI0021C9C7C2|nr:MULTISPECIES: EamA family transporter RarD [unclassified Bartonella]UXM94184.1 EamA family transporter RarD [Bartonella sp. HY329]UXN08506.1 EamA family transporter RarD [Bartonella sp. HY328]